MLSTIWFLIPLFFLLSGFFVASSSFCLDRLGEYRSREIMNSSYGRGIYLPLHRLLFPKQSFDVFVFATKISLILATLFSAATILLAFSLQPWFHSISTLLLGYIITFIVALFVLAFFPYLIALKNSEGGLSFVMAMSSIFLLLSLPITFFFLKLEEKAAQNYEENEEGDTIDALTDAVLEILQRANVRGKLTSIDKKLIESVIKFKERIVKEVMIPRVNLFCLSASISIREASQQLIGEGYSRVPVFRGNIDNIIGVLLFKDILDLYMDIDRGEKDPSILNDSLEILIKRPFYTPETKKASQLLQEFRSKQMHMAIVVDEYGGTEGIVTIEDILEEIVGEIADEYDFDEEELYTAQPGLGSWIVDARMNILDAEETFGIHIPQEGDYDTIGGYLFHRFGSIPKPGQKIHNQEFDLEIISSSERSIEKVRIIARPKNI